MNTEQLRADFEAWVKTHYYLSELGLEMEDDEYVDKEMQGAFEAYQAGRAALQSQDAKDAERYRAWRKAAASQNGNFLRLVSNELPDWDEGAVDEEKIDAAIDHARRVEGADDA